MNDQRLKQLFGAAKREKPSAPGEGFDLLVMQQIRHNPARFELSVSDLLGRWFPRLAVAAAGLIVLCVVGDLVYSSGSPSLTDSAAQVSDQYLVAEN